MTATQHQSQHQVEVHRGPSTARGPIEVTTTVVIDPTQFYGKWSAALKRLVNTSLYRFQIFISNPNELNLEGDVCKLVDKKLGHDMNEDDFIGWWQVQGRRTYSSTLNQKRQTLSNNIKALVKSKSKMTSDFMCVFFGY